MTAPDRAAAGGPEHRFRRTALLISISIALSACLAAIGWFGPYSPESDAQRLKPVASATTLPLNLPTGQSTQVITVVASSIEAHAAKLQAWQRFGPGWVPMGRAITAHVAEGGLTNHPVEGLPATPLGSYTLTQAFGKLRDPGTRMPYFQVTDADWWISQPGPLYNTHQVCDLSCPFLARSPNSRLSDQIRAYNYAVVIDYNRSPVRQGRGSAYFLHVTTIGHPTRGCIAVAQASMISILRWLRPADHPRILIGLQ